MEKINLEALVRKETGKSAAKHVRQNDMVPAIVYKDGESGSSVKVGRKELLKALHTEAGLNAIITLEIADGDAVDTRTVIVKETQIDPLTDMVLHVDFHEISLEEKINVNIPVTVKGEAVGVTEEDGVFAQALWEIEVECLPTDIPEKIEVNVEALRIGDAIHVKDLSVPEGVVILEDEDQVVVSVHVPEAEETEEPLEEGAAEPELIKKGKEEEEEGEEGGSEKE
jgi:large subunit ribosomal protein L25